MVARIRTVDQRFLNKHYIFVFKSSKICLRRWKMYLGNERKYFKRKKRIIEKKKRT